MSDKPVITTEQWLDIASNNTFDEGNRLLLAFDGDSVRAVSDQRYGANWGQRLVMHSTDHISALQALLGREPTFLEVYDSNSGRVRVAATGTTGMGTIYAARKLFEAENPPVTPPVVPPAPPTPPVQPPPPPVQPPVIEPPPLPPPPPRVQALSTDARAAIAIWRRKLAAGKQGKGGLTVLVGPDFRPKLDALLDELDKLA